MRLSESVKHSSDYGKARCKRVASAHIVPPARRQYAKVLEGRIVPIVRVTWVRLPTKSENKILILMLFYSESYPQSSLKSTFFTQQRGK